MATSSQGANNPRAGGAAVMPPAVGPIETLIEHGARLRLPAPELALVFGERAAALAESAGSERLWVHAESLAVFARIRLGHRACVVDRAVAALRAAEAGGHDELAAPLRTDLALCARSVGIPLTGLAAIRPVLADSDTPGGQRALALLQLVGCMASLGRRGVLDRALLEADELASEDPTLDSDGRAMVRAAVNLRGAAHLRRCGDLVAAVQQAQRGLELIDGLRHRAADGDRLRIRLALELVCALLDRGSVEDAAVVAKPLIAAPARAASVAPMAWLRLAVATRIQLPSGAVEGAAMLVRDALYYSGRHGLQAVTARLWLELAHIEELLGRASEAIRCMHEARVNEHLHSRVRRQAVSLLIGEFGRGEQSTVEVHRMLGEQPKRVDDRRVPSPRGAAVAEGRIPAAEAAVTIAPTSPGVQRKPLAQEATLEHAAVAKAAVANEPADTERNGSQVTPDKDQPEENVRAEHANQPAARHHAGTEPNARSVLERFGVAVGEGGRRRARLAAQDAEATADAARSAEGERMSGGASVASPRHAAEGAQASGQEQSGEPRHAGPSATEPPTSTAPPATELRPAEPPAAEPPAAGPRASDPPAPQPRPEHDPIALPRLKLPGPLAPPEAAYLVTSNTDQAASAAPAADAEPIKPTMRRAELDSVLAVFSNWNDDDEAQANGAAERRVVNGEGPAHGRHRGPA